MSNFINFNFLPWIIPLAAAPIIIHLLNRRKHRQVPWAAMRFLEAAFKRTNRRVKMEHLILLLLRILIMALLVLAISRPMVTRDSALAIMGTSKRNLILMVDTSYSMNYRGGVTETHFDRALDIAKEIVNDLSTKRGDTLTLVSVGDEPEVLQERSAWIEKGLEDVAMLEANGGHADLIAAMTRAHQICDHPEMQTQTEVIFISDFQRRDWSLGLDLGSGGDDDDTATAADPTDAPETASLRDLMARFTERRIPCTLIDVGTEKTWNLAVTSFRAEEKAIGIRRPVRITAEVTNWGTEYTSPSASLWVGDDKVATKSIGQMGPEENSSISFYHTFHEPGDFSVRVEVDPEVKDRLEADNARHLAIDVMDRVKILVVDGDPGSEGDLESETGFLKLALDPHFDSNIDSTSLFAIEECFDYDLGLKTFSEYEWVAIANLRELPEAKAEELARAVRSGTGLLLFLGDQIDPASYNQLVFGDGPGRLLPGSVGAAVLVEGEPLEFYANDFTHPVLRRFEDEDIRPILTSYPKTRGYVPYDPGADAEDMRILVRYGDSSGDPAMCERIVGSGRVILFTTSANDTWTSFPKEFGFLPLMQEVGTYLAASDSRARNLVAGEPISLDLPRFSSNATVELPNGERRRVDVRSIEEEQQRYVLSFDDTKMAGIYKVSGIGARVRTSDTDEDETLFAVHVAPGEGDLRPIDEAEIRSRYPEFDFSWRREYTRATDDSGRQREGEIWKYVLAAVLGLLLLEGALAQFFGDYSRR